MHVVDRRGRELKAGSQVHTSLGAAAVSAIEGDPPPMVRLRRTRACFLTYAGVDVNDPPGTYRCNDLELIDPEEEN